MLRILCALALIACVFGRNVRSSCNPPTTNLVVNQCITNPIVAVDLSTVKVSPYPIDPTQVLNINFNYDNTGGQTYTALDAEVGLEYYGTIFGFKCGWHSLITIPVDGCKVGGNCPLVPGDQPNSLQIDLSPYASIINGLAANSYYRLTINVKDHATGTALSCLQVAAELK